MNKQDIRLLIILLVITLLLFFLFKNDGNYAYVYYENNLIKTIDLGKNDIYTVDGYNDKVVLEVKNNKIRVVEEDSPFHLCSKQGYTNNVPIVCLPNKIVIDFKTNELDTVM